MLPSPRQETRKVWIPRWGPSSARLFEMVLREEGETTAQEELNWAEFCCSTDHLKKAEQREFCCSTVHLKRRNREYFYAERAVSVLSDLNRRIRSSVSLFAPALTVRQQDSPGRTPALSPTPSHAYVLSKAISQQARTTRVRIFAPLLPCAAPPLRLPHPPSSPPRPLRPSPSTALPCPLTRTSPTSNALRRRAPDPRPSRRPSSATPTRASSAKRAAFDRDLPVRETSLQSARRGGKDSTA